jgi:hypothetical protein
MTVATTIGEPIDRQVTAMWATGYWWRAYEWENLLVACQVCNQIWKQAVFPARTRSRRRHRVAPKPSRKEIPLLLNPYDLIDVRAHISFSSLGQPIGLSEEGRNTIATCGLFRPTLATARLRIYKQVTSLLSIIHSNGAGAQHALDVLLEIGADDAPHAGAARAFLRERDYDVMATATHAHACAVTTSLCSRSRSRH